MDHLSTVVPKRTPREGPDRLDGGAQARRPEHLINAPACVTLSPANLLALQRLAGNRATAALIVSRTKSRAVPGPGDPEASDGNGSEASLDGGTRASAADLAADALDGAPVVAGGDVAAVPGAVAASGVGQGGSPDAGAGSGHHGTADVLEHITAEAHQGAHGPTATPAEGPQAPAEATQATSANPAGTAPKVAEPL
jgi:hypothetical protein